jgi:hypothetical protein
VLRGAAGLIEAHRPTILCEVGQDVSVEVSGFLSGRGYKLFDAHADRRQRVALALSPGELLAVHESRAVSSGGE